MRIDIFTLFPGWFGWFLEQRHVRNALELGHSIEPVDLRATTPLKAGQVDDTPYGGGAGMVIRVDVVEAALDARYGPDRRRAPGGRARARGPPVRRRAGRRARGRGRSSTLLSGRYEGFDERVNEHLATDVVSIGPYVLAGGELAAMVVCDAVTRKLPGALGHEESARGGVVQRGARGRARVPALHPPLRLARAHGARRSCCRETTRRCASGGSSRAAGVVGARARPRPPSLPFRIRAAGPRQVAPLLCPASSKASNVPSCGGSRSSRRATECACTSRSSRAPAAAPRCSRAS